MSFRAIPAAALCLGFLLLVDPASTVALDRQPLEEEHRGAIGTVTVVANQLQTTIAATYDLVGVFGLTKPGPMFADSAITVANTRANISAHQLYAAESRSKEAIKLATPLIDAMDVVVIAPQASAAIQRELSKLDPFQKASFRPAYDQPSPGVLRTRLEQTETDALLLIDCRFYLSPSGNEVVVVAESLMFPSAEASAPVLKELRKLIPISGLPAPLLYRNVVFASMSAPPGDGTAIERWAADGGAAAKRAVEGGVAEIARLLAFDLQQGAPTGGSSYKVPGAKKLSLPQFSTSGTWFVIRDEQGRVWAREKNGRLGSIGEAYPEPAEATPAPSPEKRPEADPLPASTQAPG